MNWNYIFAPLLGGIIGYITNLLAIKMLFFPREPVFIGSFHLPLTPGLIPKEKQRLARAVGEAVGKHLLSEEALTEALAGPEMKAKAAAAARELLAREEKDERTLREVVASAWAQDRAEKWIAGAQDSLSSYLSRRLSEADLGTTATRAIGQSVKKRSSSALGRLVSGALDERLKRSVAQQVQSAVNGYIDRHGEEIVKSVVEKETDRLLDTRLCDLIEKNRDNLPQLEARLDALYERLIRQALPAVLRAVDLARVVRTRIEAVDNRELEEMILSVAGRELKAIVYLGAGLGFIMGFFNYFWM